MATTPVYAKIPFGVVGARLLLAEEPTSGNPDPLAANSPGDTLVMLTNLNGWAKADVTAAITGVHIGTIEIPDGAGGWVVWDAVRYEMFDTLEPIFPAAWVACIELECLECPTIGGPPCPNTIALCQAPNMSCDCAADYWQSGVASICAPFTLQLCLAEECLATADEAVLELHRVRAPHTELPYTQSIPPAQLLEYGIPADVLTVGGWYRAIVYLKNAGVTVQVITYTRSFRAKVCEIMPSVSVCLAGNVPAEVDDDPACWCRGKAVSVCCC